MDPKIQGNSRLLSSKVLGPWIPNTRDSYSGSMTPFQGDGTGSIPVSRSKGF